MADDEEAFGARLAEQLTLLGTMEGSPVGFASLKAPDGSTCSTCIRRRPGTASATMLVDALEKLAPARGAAS